MLFGFRHVHKVVELENSDLKNVHGNYPAVESSHALAYAKKLAPTMSKDQIIIVTVSGRGDKDCAAIARYRGEDLHD